MVYGMVWYGLVLKEGRWLFVVLRSQGMESRGENGEGMGGGGRGAKDAIILG